MGKTVNLKVMKVLFSLLLPFILLLTSCGDNVNIHQGRERELEMQITNKNHRITELQDSLAQCMGLADSNSSSRMSIVSKSKANKNAENDVSDLNEPGLYKNIVFKHVHVRQAGTNTPGLFPEGSDRLLFIKDVQFLSEWGLLIMLNEIYARHGLIFQNIKLSNHFNAQRWYHGTSNNVGSKLTTTEIRNIEFIKTYKYTPEPQTNNRNLNTTLPPVE